MPRKRPFRRSGFRAFVQLWAGRFVKHELGMHASAIAFRVLVALIPLTLLGLGILGAVGLEDVWRDQLAPALRPRVTPPVYRGIDYSVEQILSDSGASLLALASLLAIWHVAASVRVCMRALNTIYEDGEDRSLMRRALLSFGLAVCISLALIGSILAVTTGPKLVDHGAIHWLLLVVRWPVATAALGLAVGLLVRYAPAHPRRARWVSAGAGVVISVWVVTSLLFRWYVSALANFKTATGSLTVFLLLMTYVFTSAVIFLIGVEINELARANATEQEGLLKSLRGALG
jgi:membrane protein